MLDILANEREITIETIKKFYCKEPFCSNVRRQYPGNVIQYLFMALAKELGRRDSGQLFDKLFWMLRVYGMDTFTPRDSATTLHRMVVIH
jgi:hypothetical protein